MSRNGNKYGAKKVHHKGLVFDSKIEYKRYQQLKLMQSAGVISELEYNKKNLRYIIHDAYTRQDGKRVAALKYTPDFRYIEDGQLIIEDVKGKITTDFTIRRKLFEARYGIDVRIITKDDI